MKFRDPKTGKVFETIGKTVGNYCKKFKKTRIYGECGAACPLNAIHFEDGKPGCSMAFYSANSAEAARLMGYEIIEEEPMEKTGKPRFTEEEMTQARAAVTLFGRSVEAERDGVGLLWMRSGDMVLPLPNDRFPNLLCGRSIALEEIIGE